jgi:hypothetical protein
MPGGEGLPGLISWAPLQMYFPLEHWSCCRSHVPARSVYSCFMFLCLVLLCSFALLHFCYCPSVFVYCWLDTNLFISGWCIQNAHLYGWEKLGVTRK